MEQSINMKRNFMHWASLERLYQTSLWSALIVTYYHNNRITYY